MLKKLIKLLQVRKQKEFKLQQAIKMGNRAMIASFAKEELLKQLEEEQWCFCDKHRVLNTNE